MRAGLESGELPDGGELLGVPHTQRNRRTVAPGHETLRELQSHRTDADVWPETAMAIAERGATTARP